MGKLERVTEKDMSTCREIQKPVPVGHRLIVKAYGDPIETSGIEAGASCKMPSLTD
jgi:hypothetical protein